MNNNNQINSGWAANYNLTPQQIQQIRLQMASYGQATQGGQAVSGAHQQGGQQAAAPQVPAPAQQTSQYPSYMQQLPQYGLSLHPQMNVRQNIQHRAQQSMAQRQNLQQITPNQRQATPQINAQQMLQLRQPYPGNWQNVVPPNTTAPPSQPLALPQGMAMNYMGASNISNNSTAANLQASQAQLASALQAAQAQRGTNQRLTQQSVRHPVTAQRTQQSLQGASASVQQPPNWQHIQNLQSLVGQAGQMITPQTAQEQASQLQQRAAQPLASAPNPLAAQQQQPALGRTIGEVRPVSNQNQTGNQRPNSGGNQLPNSGGNQRPNSGGNQRPNSGGNQRPNSAGNQQSATAPTRLPPPPGPPASQGGQSAAAPSGGQGRVQIKVHKDSAVVQKGLVDCFRTPSNISPEALHQKFNHLIHVVETKKLEEREEVIQPQEGIVVAKMVLKIKDINKGYSLDNASLYFRCTRCATCRLFSTMEDAGTHVGVHHGSNQLELHPNVDIEEEQPLEIPSEDAAREEGSQGLSQDMVKVIDNFQESTSGYDTDEKQAKAIQQIKEYIQKNNINRDTAVTILRRLKIDPSKLFADMPPSSRPSIIEITPEEPSVISIPSTSGVQQGLPGSLPRHQTPGHTGVSLPHQSPLAAGPNPIPTVKVSPGNRDVRRVKEESNPINLDPDDGDDDDLVFVSMTGGKRSPRPSSTSPNVSTVPQTGAATTFNPFPHNPVPTNARPQEQLYRPPSSSAMNIVEQQTARTNATGNSQYLHQPQMPVLPLPPNYGMAVPVSVPQASGSGTYQAPVPSPSAGMLHPNSFQNANAQQANFPNVGPVMNTHATIMNNNPAVMSSAPAFMNSAPAFINSAPAFNNSTPAFMSGWPGIEYLQGLRSTLGLPGSQQLPAPHMFSAPVRMSTAVQGAVVGSASNASITNPTAAKPNDSAISGPSAELNTRRLSDPGPSVPKEPAPRPSSAVSAGTSGVSNKASSGTSNVSSKVFAGTSGVSSMVSAGTSGASNTAAAAEPAVPFQNYTSNQNTSVADLGASEDESDEEVIPPRKRRRAPILSDSDSEIEQTRPKRKKVTRLILPKDWENENPRRRMKLVLHRLHLDGHTAVQLPTVEEQQGSLPPAAAQKNVNPADLAEQKGRHELMQLAGQFNAMSDCEGLRLNEFMDVCKATEDRDMLARFPDCAIEIKTINVLSQGNVQQGRQALEKWEIARKAVNKVLGHGAVLAEACKKQGEHKRRSSLKFKMKKMPSTESEDSDYTPERWEMEATSSSNSERADSNDNSSLASQDVDSQPAEVEDSQATKKRKLDHSRQSSPAKWVRSQGSVAESPGADEEDEEDDCIDNYIEVVNHDYVCTLCGKKYKQEKNIFSHIKTIHLACSQCDRKFKSLKLLESHQQRKGHKQQQRSDESIPDGSTSWGGSSPAPQRNNVSAPAPSKSTDQNVQVIAENMDVAMLQKMANAVLKLHGQPPGPIDKIKTKDLIANSKKTLNEEEYAQALALIETYALEFQMSRKEKPVNRREGACLVQMTVVKKIINNCKSAILQWTCNDCHFMRRLEFDSLSDAANHVAQEHSAVILQLHPQIVYIDEEPGPTMAEQETASETTGNIEGVSAKSPVSVNSIGHGEAQRTGDDKTPVVVASEPDDLPLMMDVEESDGPAPDSAVDEVLPTADTQKADTSKSDQNKSATAIDVSSGSAGLRVAPGIPVAQVIEQNKETIVVSSQIPQATEGDKAPKDSTPPEHQSIPQPDQSKPVDSSAARNDDVSTESTKTSPPEPKETEKSPVDGDFILLSDTEEDSDEGESYIVRENGKKICMICMREMDSRADLRNHIRTDHLTCRTCKKTTNTISAMNQHMKTHPDKIFEPELTIMKKRPTPPEPEGQSQCINIRADLANSAMQDLIKNKLHKIKDRSTDQYRVRQVIVNAECSDGPSEESFSRTMWRLILQSRAEVKTNKPDEPHTLPCQTVVYRTIVKAGTEGAVTEHDKFEVKWRCRKCTEKSTLLSDLMEMAVHAAEAHYCRTLLICGHIEYFGPPLEITVSDDEDDPNTQTTQNTDVQNTTAAIVETVTPPGETTGDNNSREAEAMSTNTNATALKGNDTAEMASPSTTSTEPNPAKTEQGSSITDTTPSVTPKAGSPVTACASTDGAAQDNVVCDSTSSSGTTDSSLAGTPMNAVIGSNNTLYLLIDGKLTPVSVVGTAGKEGVTIQDVEKKGLAGNLATTTALTQPEITNKTCEATEDPFMCRHCNGRFTDITMLHWHLKSVHFAAEVFTDQKYCSFCRDDLMSHSALVRHINGYHKLTVYYVNKPYQKKGPKMLYPPKRHISYWFNIQTRRGDKTGCRHCGAMVKNLTWHMKTEHKALCLKCTLCKKGPKIFASVNDLGRHLTKDHSGQCQVCHENKQVIDTSGCIHDVNSRKNMVQHLRTHYFDKPYLCDFCAFNTHSIVGFTDHVNKHSGAKPHVCPKCKNGFHQRSGLKKHEQEKDCFTRKHACVQCEKKFKTVDALTRHSWTHSRQKIFKCGFTNCDKAFYTSKNLVNHMDKMHSLSTVTEKKDNPRIAKKTPQPPVLVSITKTYPKEDCDTGENNADEVVGSAQSRNAGKDETQEPRETASTELDVSVASNQKVDDTDSEEVVSIKARAEESKTAAKPKEKCEGDQPKSVFEDYKIDDDDDSDRLVVDESELSKDDESEKMMTDVDDKAARQQIDEMKEAEEDNVDKDASNFDVNENHQGSAGKKGDAEEDHPHAVGKDSNCDDDDVGKEDHIQPDANRDSDKMEEEGEVEDGEMLYNDENKMVHDATPSGEVQYPETQEFEPMEESPELEDCETGNDANVTTAVKSQERSSLCPLRENVACEGQTEDEKNTAASNKQEESKTCYQRLLEIDGVSTKFLRPKSSAQEVQATLRREIKTRDRYILIRCGSKNVLDRDVLESIAHFGDLIEEARELCTKKDILICAIPPCIGKDKENKVLRLNSFIRYICDKYSNVHLVDTTLTKDDLEDNGVHLNYQGNLKVLNNILKVIMELDISKYGKVKKAERRKSKDSRTNDEPKRRSVEDTDKTGRDTKSKQGGQVTPSRNKLRLSSQHKPSSTSTKTSQPGDSRAKSSWRGSRRSTTEASNRGQPSPSPHSTRSRSAESRSRHRSSGHSRATATLTSRRK